MSTGDCTRISVSQDGGECDSDLDCPVGQVCKNGTCAEPPTGGGDGALSRGALIAAGAVAAYYLYRKRR